jgi:hypothetical protein
LFRGIPEHIRSDNGPEFVAEELRTWLAKLGTGTLYIHMESYDVDQALASARNPIHGPILPSNMTQHAIQADSQACYTSSCPYLASSPWCSFGMYSRGHKFWQENPFARSVYQAMVPVKDGRAS